MEFIYTDVLVLGGGIAGMRAALAARHEGAQVVLLAKKKIGKSGSSLVANTGHRIFPLEPLPGLDFYQQTIESGQGLADPELVQILGQNSLPAIQELQKWGCPLELEYDSKDQPLYARCQERKGILVSQALRQRCIQSEIDLRDYYTVVQLVKLNGRIIGAFAIHRNKLYCFLASAVILTLGGVGRLYYPTDNPLDICGESVALAWEVGAELMDLEFIQFYPYQLKEPTSMDIHTSVFRLGAYLVNEEDERFMESLPDQELSTRDIVCCEMFMQEGDIYLDLSDVDLEELGLLNPRLLKYYYSDQDLVVSPIQHFYMGGVSMDAQGRSSLPGLYVCGEAAAGVHGANRLGGNALTECNVFGRIAGQTAAREGRKNGLEPSSLPTQKILEQLKLPPGGKDNYTLVQTRLTHIMWNAVGIVRDGEGLYRALKEIRDELEVFSHSKPYSISEWFETKHMLQTAHLITGSALMREESRGAHYRLDFPEKDPEWDCHIVVVGDRRLLKRRRKRSPDDLNRPKN